MLFSVNQNFCFDSRDAVTVVFVVGDSQHRQFVFFAGFKRDYPVFIGIY